MPGGGDTGIGTIQRPALLHCSEVSAMQVVLELMAFVTGATLALATARLVLGAFLTVAFGRHPWSSIGRS